MVVDSIVDADEEGVKDAVLQSKCKLRLFNVIDGENSRGQNRQEDRKKRKCQFP